MALEDTVRVLRVVEYVGLRSRVEKTIAESVHGSKHMDGLTISAATIGAYPEILKIAKENEDGK